VKRASLATVASMILVVLAGCGSSSRYTSAGGSPAASTPTTGSSASAGTSATSAKTAQALITTKHDKLGTILAMGPKRLTVYLFEADKGKTSSCTGSCAAVWPPVTGPSQVGGQALAADLGTITRADGTTQVTYNGHPLYLYSTDKDRSDTYGQGIKSFGSSWYVLAPSGRKVDKS
jgi:predicted lipoprotein with Yx(FWY)xxD motif